MVLQVMDGIDVFYSQVIRLGNEDSSVNRREIYLLMRLSRYFESDVLFNGSNQFSLLDNGGYSEK